MLFDNLNVLSKLYDSSTLGRGTRFSFMRLRC
jgi:hypothetical protein